MTRVGGWLIGEIEAIAREWADLAQPLKDNAELLADLRAARKVLSTLERDVETVVADNMEDQRMDLDGMVLERRKRSKPAKWDSERLFRDVVQLGDPSLLGKVLPLTPSLGWRSTALTELGFDPDDYRERTWLDSYTVQVTGASHA